MIGRPGGLSSAAAEAVAESGHGAPIRRIGVRDRHPDTASGAPFMRKRVDLPDGNEIRCWIEEHL
jgi:transketolase C-terminal domain/subunit